jgi:L-rhamnose mutarotase
MSDNKNSFSSSLYSNLDILLQSVLGDEILLTVDHAIQDYIQKVEFCKIDYSDVKDNYVRNQLEHDNQMMLVARARNSFVEYCKCAAFSIESILDYFHEKEKDDFDIFVSRPNNEKFVRMGKYGQLAHWWDFMNEGDYNQKYWQIVNLLKIRDATSHKRLGVTSVVEMITIFNNKPHLQSMVPRIIDFYDKKDFGIVKTRTEWIVKKTLTHFQLL